MRCLLYTSTPGGACALCELNKFGTDGKGKACKNMRHLYIPVSYTHLYTIDEMVFDGHMDRERLLETLKQAYEEHLKKAAKP